MEEVSGSKKRTTRRATQRDPAKKGEKTRRSKLAAIREEYTPLDTAPNPFVPPSVAVAPTPTVSAAPNPRRREPCPDGQRRDAKTGLCRPRTEAENLYIQRRRAKRQGLDDYPPEETEPIPPNNNENNVLSQIIQPQEKKEEEPEEPAANSLYEFSEVERYEPPLVDVSIRPVEQASAKVVSKPIDEPMDESSSSGDIEMYNEPVPVKVNDAEQAPGIEETPQEEEVIPSTQVASIPDASEQAKEHLAENPSLYSLQEEKKEYEANRSVSDPDGYPSVNDPRFQEKIAAKPEFFGQQYDPLIYDIAKRADELCHAEFELTPHQLFIKQFLSPETPYNSLLLYHGLGTGKTCTAIGVAESYRQYMKQTGHMKKILVVANANVLQNFRTQLFDESKMGDGNGSSCVGSALLDEVAPFAQPGSDDLPTLAERIRKVIRRNYEFVGYTKLARMIYGIIQDKVSADNKMTPEAIAAIQQFFDDRLVIIDEVHNIRNAGSNRYEGTTEEDEPTAYGVQIDEEKRAKDMGKIGELMTLVATHAQNMRLLLLSATPVFDNFAEIVWLTNLLNLNDKRPPIAVGDVFALKDTADLKRGQFLPARSLPSGIVLESGRDLLARKLTGYVSYVRSENPYAFPFRVYPDVFAPERTVGGALFPVPKRSYDGQELTESLKFLKVYGSPMHPLQQTTYRNIVRWFRSQNREKMILIYLIQACNMVYGSIDENAPLNQIVVKNTLGERGFSSVIKRTGNRKAYSYVDNKGPRLFSPALLPSYSCKIAAIVDAIRNATGVVMVYSQFLEIGVVSVALALEEAGFLRYGGSNKRRTLFANGLPDVPKLDATTRPLSPTGNVASPAQYIMITGDSDLSPDNKAHVAQAVSPENKDGSIIKVILISDAGSEGIDFKNIRQVHVLEPWYNMNQIEQVIGRAVRNKSHCALPFVERNVEIYLHTCIMDSMAQTPKKTEAPGFLTQLGLAGGSTASLPQVASTIPEVAETHNATVPAAVPQAISTLPASNETQNAVYGTVPLNESQNAVSETVPVNEIQNTVPEATSNKTQNAVSETVPLNETQITFPEVASNETQNAVSETVPLNETQMTVPEVASNETQNAVSETVPEAASTVPDVDSAAPQPPSSYPPVGPLEQVPENGAEQQPSILASLSQTIKSVGETLSNLAQGSESFEPVPLTEKEKMASPPPPPPEPTVPEPPVASTQLANTPMVEQQSVPMVEQQSVPVAETVSQPTVEETSEKQSTVEQNAPVQQNAPEAETVSQPPVQEALQEEAIDLCIYRKYAEKKAVVNGQITRLLKEVSIDCLLNVGQMNMTVEKLQTIDANRNIQIHPASAIDTETLVPFQVGDRGGTEICDYMDSCEYTTKKPPTEAIGSYGLRQSVSFLLPRIKALFREHTFLTRDELFYQLSKDRPIPVEQIYATLNALITDPSHYVIDRFGRVGRVVAFETSYFFQPADLTDPRASLFERTIPLAVRQSSRMILLPTAKKAAATAKPAASMAASWAADLADTRVQRSAEDILQRGRMVLAYATNPDAVWDELDEDEYRDEPEVLEGNRELRQWCHLVRRLAPVLERLDLLSELPTTIFEHYFDTLPTADRLTLLQASVGSSDSVLANYFEKRRIFQENGEEIYHLYSTEEAKLLFYRHGEDGSWSPVSSDYSSVQEYLRDVSFFQQFRTDRLVPIFGFLWPKRDTWVFKLKEKKIAGERNQAKEGAACGTHGFKLMRTAASIEGPGAHLFQAIATLSESSGNKRQHTTLPELCCLSEIALRSLNISDPDHTYLLTTEMFSTLYGNI